MSTTLANCRKELSKQLGDFWDSTTTSAGATGGTTIVDTLLGAKAADWIGDQVHSIITTATDASVDEERLISALSVSTGTLTTLAHTAQIGSGKTYEVHRLFTPSEKRRALVHAAKSIYPSLFINIRDESMVSGNWLKDGSFEIWSSTSALTHWTKSASTLTKTSTAYYFEHGSYSCKIATAAGYIQQSVTNWDDIKRLVGTTPTFTVRGWCNTASNLRISINDGTTETFSSYHDGDSAWTRDNAPLTVTQTIADNATEITFKIYHRLEAASETSYVDDARVIIGGVDSPRIYIGDLGLVQNKPHQVLIENADHSEQEPWALINNIKYDQTNGYMYLPSDVSADYRLRILGAKYLDFYDTSDDVGTDWADTIAIDKPQLDILVAEAALYLYTNMSMPNFTSGTREKYMEMMGFWKTELRERKARFSMQSPPATVSYR